MKTRAKIVADKVVIRTSIFLFVCSIGVAYIVYPHWVTFSLLALQLHTLPFFLCAMAATIFLFLHTGRKLRLHNLRGAGTAMYVSAACVGLVVLIPYKNSGVQLFLHNTAALLFVLFAAAAIAWLARGVRDRLLAVMAVLQVGLCIFELALMARYSQHPVQSWVWVILQMVVTILLLLSLLRIFALLEKSKEEILRDR